MFCSCFHHIDAVRPVSNSRECSPREMAHGLISRNPTARLDRQHTRCITKLSPLHHPFLSQRLLNMLDLRCTGCSAIHVFVLPHSRQVSARRIKVAARKPSQFCAAKTRQSKLLRKYTDAIVVSQGPEQMEHATRQMPGNQQAYPQLSNIHMLSALRTLSKPCHMAVSDHPSMLTRL